MGKIDIALIGNPNCGKTTLFNTMTGANHYVGNWPGVTVEKKEGYAQIGDRTINIVDLPGIYSLSPYSIEERVSRAYIVDEKPSVVVNIIDGTTFERSFYLTTQLMALNRPMVLAINMCDELEKQNIHFNYEKLSEMTGIEVVMISASHNRGLDELNQAIINASKLEDVSYFDKLPFKDLLGVAKEAKISEASYQFATQVSEEIIDDKAENINRITDKIDNILLNQYFGLPIFFLVMGFVFFMTFTIGNIFTDMLDGFVADVFSPFVFDMLMNIGVSEWLVSLIVDGIISGVGGVIVFVPNIAILFFFISIMEDSGYMTRVAYVMDKWMEKVGLNGRTFMPMVLGFGCNVPAIMATRTIENEKDRLLAILINPFMSCGARFPVYILFASVFFPGNETLVTYSLYLLGIVVALFVAFIFRKTLFKENNSYFIIELPKYRFPKVSSLLIHVWERVKGYLTKAGTVIFAASIFLWFLLNFNTTGMVPIDESFGAIIGKGITPLLEPLGFGTWQVSLSLLTGMVAKELIISNMSIIFGYASESANGFAGTLQSVFTPLSAYVFMVFVLLYTPCVAVIGVIKRETNSWKWTIFSVVYQLIVAWGVAFLVYRIGLLIL